jgi:uncharacterized protein (TIGR02217 family)
VSFNETLVFPRKFALGALGGPKWTTNTVRTRGGAQKRNRVWSMPLYQYDLSHAVRTREEMEEMLEIFNVQGGGADGFRLWDFLDYQATVTQGVVLDNGDGTFQLQKRYSKGALTLDRNILKPVSGTVSVSGSCSYSLNYTTGVITVTSGADPTGWTGQFDVPVHFVTDLAQYSMIDRNRFTWEQIVLEELRNPD